MSNHSYRGGGLSPQPRKKAAASLAALLAASVISCTHAQYWTPGPGELALSPPPPDNVVYAMLDDGGSGFYAGGQFSSPFATIAHWDGTQWDSIGIPCWDAGSTAYALLEFNGHLYAGGDFINDPDPTVEGDETHFGLVRYIPGLPDNWIPVGHNGQFLDGVVYALTEYDGMLILGGDFTTPNGLNNISAWDGTEWTQLGGGSGSNGTIYALAAMTESSGSERLYAGGDFTNIGSPGLPDIPLHEKNLAVFNGGGWNQGLGAANGIVKALYAVDSGSLAGLYIGGWFDRIGSRSGLDYVAHWNGWTMDDMNGGTSGVVEAFSAFSGPSLASRIAVGGQFFMAGSTLNVQNVAAWGTSGWAEMDTGVSDGSSRPGAVKALCAAPGGCYAAGDIAQCGSSFQMSSHVARFQDISKGYVIDDFIDALTHGSLEALEGPYWRFSQDDEDPASCRWGVTDAEFQRVAWDPESLTIGERLNFSIDEAERGTFDMSIWREQGPGPFLPPHEVFEFTPHDLAPGSAISVLVLTANGLIEYGFIEAPLESGRIEIDGSILATTISNGFFWNQGEVVVVDLAEASSITIGGGSIENVTAFGVFWQGTEGSSKVNPFNLQLQGDLTLDVSESGFGFQNHLHRLEGGEGFGIEGDSLAIDMTPNSVLDVLVIVDGFWYRDTGIADEDWNHARTEMSFYVEDADPNWSLSMTVDAGIIVGNPPGPVSQITLEGRGDGAFATRYEADTEDMNQPHFVRLMNNDEVIAEFVIPTGYLEFTTTGIAGDAPYNVGFDSSTSGGFINWTAPGLVVFEGNGNLPPIEGPTGMIIGKTEGSDGDDIWDVLQQTSLTVTTHSSLRLRVLEELFTPFWSEPENAPGDINGDGRVDGQDLAELLGAWGSDDADADINGDGVVNGQDLAELLGSWN